MARKGSTQLPEYVAKPGMTAPEDPDLLEQLNFEHRQIERLWSELQLAHQRRVQERPEARYGSAGQRELGRQIVHALARHEALELEQLYPLAEQAVGEAWTEHARADHADVSELLDEVDGEDPEDESVFEIFTTVLTTMLRHIEEEERIVFPMVRVLVPAEELRLSGGAAPPPREVDVIDIAAAEREEPGVMTGGGGDDGAGDDGGEQRPRRRRLGLRRR